MANIALGWVNHADLATLSGGLWTTGLPLTNLQTRFRSEVARTQNLLTTSTKFAVDFGSATKIVRWVILDKHNMSPSATVRVKAGSTPGGSDLADTGESDVWEATPTRDLRWEDPNWWTGTLSPDDVAGYPISLFLDIGGNIKARYWTIEIADTGNSAGYIEIGRLWMGPFWSPTRNASWGANLKWEPKAREQETDSGVMFFGRRRPTRVYGFQLPAVDDDEAFGTLLDLQRIAGMDGEVVVIPDKDDRKRGYRRNLIGHLTTADPLEQVFYGFQSAGFVVKEFR